MVQTDEYERTEYKKKKEKRIETKLNKARNLHKVLR